MTLGMRLQSNTTVDTRVPFSRADARAAGIKLSELVSPRYRRLLYDVYICAAARADLNARAAAALAVAGPGAYVSHTTAAELWGAVVPQDDDLHVAVPEGKPRCERRGIKAHRAPDAARPVQKAGLPVSSPVQCLLEMAGDGIGLVDLVVAGDGLLKLKRFGLADLKEAATRWSGRGAKRARRAVSLIRDGVDSPMETRLRLLLVLAGLPEPEVNFILRGPDGQWVVRFDLCFRHLKLVIEYDGRYHGDSSDQWKRDSRRREDLDRLGWRLIIIHSDGIYDRPEETLDRVSDILRELGDRSARRTYREEFRRHFPGRS